MCEHPRTPLYNKSKTHRIISLANGQWQLQEHNGHKGTKTSDPWVKASQAGSLREIHAMLGATEISS